MVGESIEKRPDDFAAEVAAQVAAAKQQYAIAVLASTVVPAAQQDCAAVGSAAGLAG